MPKSPSRFWSEHIIEKFHWEKVGHYAPFYNNMELAIISIDRKTMPHSNFGDLYIEFCLLKNKRNEDKNGKTFAELLHYKILNSQGRKKLLTILRTIAKNHLTNKKLNYRVDYINRSELDSFYGFHKFKIGFYPK